MVTLTEHGYVLEVSPELGASILGLTYQGRPVLRPVPTDVTNSGDTGCFPLIPYANRIENGVFHYGDTEIHLPMTFSGHPHSLHGHGWRTVWQVIEKSASHLVLAYEHSADSWPWAYRGEQSFRLSEDGLHISLAVENRSTQAMPFSLGLHPWFPRTAATVLTASVYKVWLADDTTLPTEAVAGDHFLDLAHGAKLIDAPFVDHCHTGWKGPAIIHQPDFGLKVTLTASPECQFLHIYAPVGSDFVCAEPVTAMPNAVNRSEPAALTGARMLAPAERFAMEMVIKAERT